MARRQVQLVSASRADDLAYRALLDVAEVSQVLPETRVVGGLMVQLLLAAFPVPGVEARRTVDADAAVTPQVAASGDVDRLLRERGYETPVTANRYEWAGRVIDVLVPSGTRFGLELLGGRAFDAVPGMLLALAGPGLPLACEVLLLDGGTATCAATVPGVEAAVVLKALATADRTRESDLVDLRNLLEIVAAHPREGFGGWRLAEPGLVGARRDAARALHVVANRLAVQRRSTAAQQRLVALIRSFVAR